MILIFLSSQILEIIWYCSISEFKITEDDSYSLGHQFSFKELLLRLYEIEGTKHNKYWSVMYHYVHDKYKAIAEKREPEINL